MSVENSMILDIENPLLASKKNPLDLIKQVQQKMNKLILKKQVLECKINI